MDGIRQYLISVIAAAIISGIAVSFIQKNSVLSSIAKLICGLFMVVTVITPTKAFDFSNLSDLITDFSKEAQEAVDTGEAYANQQLRENIMQQAQAYIQKRAQDLGVDLVVDVKLTGEDPPVPSAVTIVGSVSPYIKSVLSEYIENNLDIPEEKQIWM